MISFIIPYHNEPQTMLAECIHSILALPLGAEQREIVVVDDGSSVSPQDMLQSMDSHIIYHWQQNQGPSAARNKGIELAKGRYIQFVDADDALLTEEYTRVLQLLREEDVDMVMFRFTTDRKKRHADESHTITSGAEYLLHNNLFSSPCKQIFSRQALGDLRFPVGIFHEDEVFTPQLILRCQRMISTLNTAYFYRQHSGTTMHNTTMEHRERRLRDFRTAILMNHGLSESLQGTEHEAMMRCVHQQVMAYIYNTWMLTHSLRRTHQAAKLMQQDHLMPLPPRRYTMKYLLFAILSRLLLV